MFGCVKGVCENFFQYNENTAVVENSKALKKVPFLNIKSLIIAFILTNKKK